MIRRVNGTRTEARLFAGLSVRGVSRWEIKHVRRKTMAALARNCQALNATFMPTVGTWNGVSEDSVIIVLMGVDERCASAVAEELCRTLEQECILVDYLVNGALAASLEVRP